MIAASVALLLVSVGLLAAGLVTGATPLLLASVVVALTALGPLGVAVVRARPSVEDRDHPVEDRDHPVEDRDHPVEDRDHPVEDRDHPVEDRDRPVEDRDRPRADATEAAEGRAVPPGPMDTPPADAAATDPAPGGRPDDPPPPDRPTA